MDRLKNMLAQDAPASRPRAAGNPLAAGPRDVYGTPDGRIVVIARTIKRALERAGEVLEESIMNLDYEILEHGSGGFLGIGAKPYRLIIGKAAAVVDSFSFAGGGGDEYQDSGVFSQERPVALPANRNGEVRIRVRKSGIFMTVTPPAGSGNPASPQQAQNELFMRAIAAFDRDLVSRAVEERSGEPVRIGDWVPNEMFDSKLSIEVSADEMKAFATVRPPEKSGRILELEDVVAHLDLKGVKYGILEDSIKNMLEKDIFNQPVMVASGKPVEHGSDSLIEYKFRTSDESVELKETEDGRTDFKDLDLVQNVVVGQVLAVKTPATTGNAGRTVTNRRIDAKPGSDIPLLAGKNASLSDDGLEVTSQINGQVVFVAGKINVEPILEVANVDLESGNIVFLGTVVVKGNVEDGFSIKAAGNVNVRGTVGKSQIEAEGDIIVKNGVLGRDEAVLRAGNDMMAKFIEHAKIIAGNDVVVSESISFSFVDAGNRVLCVGKKAVINAGRIRAREEVNAKEIGSRSSTETLIEVGIDPKSREKVMQLEEEKRAASETIGNLAKNIITLQNQKGSGFLPEAKEQLLQDSIIQKAELEARVKEINAEVSELREYLNQLEVRGKVSAQRFVHPGTKIQIKNARLDVKEGFKFVTFLQDAGSIKIVPYEDYAKKSPSERRAK